MTPGQPGQALIKVTGVQNKREFHQTRKIILTHKLWELQQFQDPRITFMCFFMHPLLHTIFFLWYCQRRITTRQGRLVNRRPYTRLTPPLFLKKKITWHVTPDMWHLTHDTWHMTYTPWWGVNNLSIFHLPSSNGLGFMISWRLAEKRLVTQWMNQLRCCIVVGVWSFTARCFYLN